MTRPADYEELTSFLGEWGPFQWRVFLLLSLSTVPNGYAGMTMVFLSDTPAHRCAPGPNGSEAEMDGGAPPREAGDETARCARYRWPNGTSNETEGCVDGWEYSKEKYLSTIVTEWDLVCHDAWKVPFSLSIYFFGVVTGSFVSGQISDRFGRKFTLFVTMAMQTIFSLAQVASTSWEMFCVFFFIVGVGQISNYVAALVLGSELLGKSSRESFNTVGVCLFYALGYALLPLVAYFIRSWRILLTVLSLPGLLYIPLWWFIPESPRWLLSQGRLQEAEAVVRAAAKQNRVTAPAVIFHPEDSIELQNSNGQSTGTAYTYFDLVRTQKIRAVTLLNIPIWFIITIGYFGLSLNAPNMNGDPYLNCLLFAAMEMGAYLVTWPLLKVAPRQAIVSSTLLGGGVALLVIYFLPQDLNVLGVTMVMAAKFGITAALTVLYIIAVELFPTVVRGMGLGLCSVASKTGSMISPFFPFLGKYNKALPYILMGVLTLIAGLLSLLLPETKGTDLPEDLAEVQAINLCCRPARQTRTNHNVEEEKDHQLSDDL